MLGGVTLAQDAAMVPAGIDCAGTAVQRMLKDVVELRATIHYRAYELGHGTQHIIST
jgi:hypothetical protein